MSALFCADEVLIPVRCDNFSLDGFETTMAMILDLETREDVKIDVLGVVLTQVERTAAVNLVRQMFEENQEYASVLFKTGIRKGSAVPNAPIPPRTMGNSGRKLSSVCLKRRMKNNGEA